jgi:hypothetical protein
VNTSIQEAATRYLGWQMYWHNRPDGGC